MHILEFQARERLEHFGIAVVPGHLVSTAQDVYEVAAAYGKSVLLKPQILNYLEVIAHSPEEASNKAQEIVAEYPDTEFLVVPQIHYERSLSLSISLDRVVQQPVLTARNHQEGITAHEHIEPLLGLRDYQVTNVAGDLNLSREYWPGFIRITRNLYQCYRQSDSTHAEINPLVVIDQDTFVAMGTLMSIDDNAIYRQPFVRLPGAYSPLEIAAFDAGIRFLRFQGQIGCLVNGAGLGMSVNDLIHEYGQGQVTPANFLDLCGSVTIDKIALACRLLLQEAQNKVILIVVFAGIVRCDEVASAVVNVFDQAECSLPVVLRFEGTNAAQARELVQNAAVPNFYLESSLMAAVLKAVQLAGERG